jgi:Cu+-exporting ATPase
MTEKTFNIIGMHCRSCVQLIEGEIASQKGVASISVNLLAGTARVVYDESLTHIDILTSAVRDLGYSTSYDQ